MSEVKQVVQQALLPRIQIIADAVEAGASVLDVGCGTGDLLSYLVRHKGVRGRGLELSQSKTSTAIARGLSVVQGNMTDDLPYYSAKSYDYVVCSGALQATTDPKGVLLELIRIGKTVIVLLPNFGFWRNRAYLGLKGRMPMSKTLTYEWYETPNIHFCTLHDFVELCNTLDLTILQSLAIGESGKVTPFEQRNWRANLFGEAAVFVLQG